MIRRIARPMLASTFLVSGADAVKDPQGRASTAGPFLARLAPTLRLPQDPELLVRVNGAAMLAGGALLATGRLPRLASAVLAATLVPTTLSAHAFWDEADPQVRSQQRTQFLKNLGLLGGLLLGTADTAGKPGLAWRAGRAREAARKKLASAQDALG